MTGPTQLPMDGLAARHRNHDLFSDHYLDVLLRDNRHWRNGLAETERFMIWLADLYEREQSHLPNYSEEQLEQHWFRPIFAQLGHIFESQAVIPALAADNGHAKRPDYVFFPAEAARQTALAAQHTAAYAVQALAVGEVKKWDVFLSKKQRRGDASFDAQNPSWQIDYYLRATGLKWGILTNGPVWRLVHADTSYKLSVYYEVNLLDLLTWGNVEAMRYFVLFFRQAAFTPDDEGRIFVNEVLTGSRDYAVALEKELRDNAYLALEKLMQGFLDVKQNGLTEADLPAIFENSLYLLYRLLFILYGESQGLLPMRHPVYREQYSLKALKLPATDKSLLATGKRYWYYLQTLFEIINGDDPHTNAELGIPRYNGGLFDPQQHPFLVEHIIGDRALVEALRLLARRTYQGLPQNVDYRALGVRQLGSIYEGLLEYQPRYAAVELACVRAGKSERWLPTADLSATDKVTERRQPGQVYLVTDRGERKATGSYYTPDYIVKYIVENTLGPLAAAVREQVKQQAKAAVTTSQRRAIEQSFAEEILKLKILDPAMGSGHFLVEATDYLARIIATDPYLEHEAALETDLIYWKRRVVERCIYGVDKNPMAVELAKLSLWLSTVAADRPLSFLDHHLRCGDALVGARVSDLGDPPPPLLSAGQRQARRQEAKAGARQANLFEQRLTEKLPVVLGRILEITGRDSNNYEDVHAKEAIDRAVQALKAPFEAVANLWVSAYFGHNYSADDYHQAVELLSRPDELFNLPPIQRAQAMTVPPPGGDYRAGQPSPPPGGTEDKHLPSPPPGGTEDKHLPSPPLGGTEDKHLPSPPPGMTEDKHLPSPPLGGTEDKHLPSPPPGMTEGGRQGGRRFFHWELAFPEVFFDAHGQPLADRAGFDAVVGNPPWGAKENLLTDEDYDYLQKLQVDNLNYYPYFIVIGLNLLHPFKHFAMVLPDSLLAKAYPETRKFLLNSHTLKEVVHLTKPFPDVEHDVITIRAIAGKNVADFIETRIVPKGLEDISSIPTKRVSYEAWNDELYEFRFNLLIDETVETLTNKLYTIGIPYEYICETHEGIHTRHKRAELFPETIDELTFRHKPLLIGERAGDIIEPYYIHWNGRYVNYDPTLCTPNSKGMTPDLVNEEWFTQIKLIIVRTGEQFTTAIDYEHFYLSNNLFSSFKKKDAILNVSYEYLCCLLNSKLLQRFLRIRIAPRFGTLYVETKIKHLDLLPIRRIDFTTPTGERAQLVAAAQELYHQTVAAAGRPPLPDTPLLAFTAARLAAGQTDVLHDLLAYLAGQMIELNQQKHRLTEAFWLDLEGVTDETTFKKLRAKGKQEASLAQQPAVAAYVSAHSHSSRSLDESLGWAEAAFKAFAKLLTGQVKGLAALVEVYRQHAPAYAHGFLIKTEYENSTKSGKL